MSGLRRDLGIADGDAVYESLVDMLDGLDDEQAMRVLAKLVLLLANHVGDERVIEEAIAAAQAVKE
jgi:hypothetical protein